MNRLRARAEQVLLDVRGDPAVLARPLCQLETAPLRSKAVIWVGCRRKTACAEFARTVCARRRHGNVGVLSRLVHSRFGLHVVEVLSRDPGQQPVYEEGA